MGYALNKDESEIEIMLKNFEISEEYGESSEKWQFTIFFYVTLTKNDNEIL